MLSQTKTSRGENMRKFDLNSARSHVGRNVNLHLKDGSVIINVLITNAQRNNHDKNATLYYTTTTKKLMKVSLKKIEWAERLNPNLFMPVTCENTNAA